MNNTLRACLHGGGGPQIGEVTCGGSRHLYNTIQYNVLYFETVDT